MICNCPYCAETLPEKLIDGFILCPHCNRLIESTNEHRLIAAYRVMKKNHVVNYKQFKYQMQLSDKDISFLAECSDNECLSVEEFERKLKTPAC